MEQEFPAHLFLETIESEGALRIWEDPEQPYISQWMGPNRRTKVTIVTKGEFITNTVAKEYLRQLEMEDLIKRMF